MVLYCRDQWSFGLDFYQRASISVTIISRLTISMMTIVPLVLPDVMTVVPGSVRFNAGRLRVVACLAVGGLQVGLAAHHLPVPAAAVPVCLVLPNTTR